MARPGFSRKSATMAPCYPHSIRTTLGRSASFRRMNRKGRRGGRAFAQKALSRFTPLLMRRNWPAGRWGIPVWMKG
jgi:hypothetical protein